MLFFKQNICGVYLGSIKKNYLTILFLFFALDISVLGNTKDSITTSLEEYKVDTSIIDSSVLSATQFSTEHKEVSNGVYWVLMIVLATVLAGIFVRFKKLRQFRSFFLVASIILLGFYRGACPCPIQSLQNIFLMLLGQSIKWQSLIYFLALLPITYLFGRVFCGWVCHLGALQEFIFMTSSFKIFQSKKAQKIMRMIRIFALLSLVIQLILTQSNLYKKIDPFTIIFNFQTPYLVGWFFVGLMILSSVLIYRPFCKTICPIGLILGWISKISGASILGTNENCISCNICNNKCKIRAITHDNKMSDLENEECIRCGDCLTGCKKNAISFFHKNKTKAAIVKFENNIN